MKLGSLDITPLSDGVFKMPPQFFGVNDWAGHFEGELDDQGRISVPIGCFLIRNGEQTILVDAGLGPIDMGPGAGGALMGELEGAGCRPEDIDLLLFTHLHLDHIGWALQDDKLMFPNATVRFGEQDLDQFIRVERPDRIAAPVVAALDAAGKLDPISDDGEVAKGVSTLHAPGHTLGHRCIVLSSGDERALLLGDAISCPQQLVETDWGAMSDVDPALAARTRAALWDELEGTGSYALGAHFPGLQFGRVLTGQGKRYFS